MFVTRLKKMKINERREMEIAEEKEEKIGGAARGGREERGEK